MVTSTFWPRGNALRKSPSKTNVALGPVRVTMDLLGWPTLDSKNSTLCTLPRCTSPDELDPPEPRDPGFALAPLRPLNISNRPIVPQIPEMVNRMRLMNRPSTVKISPLMTTQAIPKRGIRANRNVVIKLIECPPEKLPQKSRRRKSLGIAELGVPESRQRPLRDAENQKIRRLHRVA